MSQSKNSILLEVDPSIIEKNILISKDSSMEDDIKKYFVPEKPASKLVKPLPGFCIKTWIQDGDKKVFINVCQTDQIPPPDDVTDDELIKILSSEEPSSYRVPMSIQDAHSESDRAGQSVTVYDVAVNTNFFQKIQNSPVFHKFFLTVIFEALQDKYQFELEMDKYVVLKNKKSFGVLQTHRIQRRDVEKCIDKTYTPLIEEINTLDKESFDVNKNLFLPKNEHGVEEKLLPNYIKYTLRREPAQGSISYLIGEFNIDGMLFADEVNLDVGEDRIIVAIPKSNQIVDIFIPYIILQNNVSALLNHNTGILTVKMAACDAA